MRPAFFAALIAAALVFAPSALSADHRHQSQPASSNDDRHHHDATAPSHDQTATHQHNDQSHPHGHTTLQRLHNLLFGRYHHNGTCTTSHNPPGHTDEHKGHTADAHCAEHSGTQLSR